MLPWPLQECPSSDLSTHWRTLSGIVRDWVQMSCGVPGDLRVMTKGNNMAAKVRGIGDVYLPLEVWDAVCQCPFGWSHGACWWLLQLLDGLGYGLFLLRILHTFPNVLQNIPLFAFSNSHFSWVSQSFACILTRTCSRAVSLLASMVGSGTLAADVVSRLTEEESPVGKYTEESRRKPNVYWFRLGVGPRLTDPFLMLGQLLFGLSPETSRES